MLGRLWGVVSLMALAACGSRALAPRDAAPADAPVTDSAAGSDGPCRSPTSCNDDPTSSEPAGICQIAGDPPIYWACTCSDGYSVNPRTALCRKGSTCVAAGGDQWPVRMALDTSDCASRPVQPCSGAAPDPDIIPFLRSCAPTPGSVDFYGTIRLELVNGCVALLEMNGLGWNPSPLPAYEADQVPCDAQRLSSVRFSCGHETDCVLVTQEPPDPIP